MPDWGSLVFFDTEERRLPGRLPLPGLIFPAWDIDETKILARIPKLGSQWRIIFDFKPTGLPSDPPRWVSDTSDTHNCEVLNHLIMLKDSRPLVFPVFTFRGIRLIYRDDQERTKETGDMPLPKPGDWNRLEVSHEEGEEGKYFLSLTLEDKKMCREEMATNVFASLTDVGNKSGFSNYYQHGLIRQLVVLDKK